MVGLVPVNCLSEFEREGKPGRCRVSRLAVGADHIALFLREAIARRLNAQVPRLCVVMGCCFLLVLSLLWTRHGFDDELTYTGPVTGRLVEGHLGQRWTGWKRAGNNHLLRMESSESWLTLRSPASLDCPSTLDMQRKVGPYQGLAYR